MSVTRAKNLALPRKMEYDIFLLLVLTNKPGRKREAPTLFLPSLPCTCTSRKDAQTYNNGSIVLLINLAISRSEQSMFMYLLILYYYILYYVCFVFEKCHQTTNNALDNHIFVF